MFSSPSYAEWTKVSESVDGDTAYIDFDRIRKVNEYVYFWFMIDLLKPDSAGDFSAKFYYQGDCKLFRKKRLSFSSHSQPMGEGAPSTSYNKPDTEWTYPHPDSMREDILNAVCKR